MSEIRIANPVGFCSQCNQYGCHLITCQYAFLSAPPRQSEVQTLKDEIKKLKVSGQELAEELHAALNESMYAGTRKDWIWRAQKAEAEVERMKDRLELLEEFYEDHKE